MENGITPSGPPVFVMHEGSAEEAVRLVGIESADIEVAFLVSP
jgi:hypothetical protein